MFPLVVKGNWYSTGFPLPVGIKYQHGNWVIPFPTGTACMPSPRLLACNRGKELHENIAVKRNNQPICCRTEAVIYFCLGLLG